jgi:hypothetical protein
LNPPEGRHRLTVIRHVTNYSERHHPKVCAMKPGPKPSSGSAMTMRRGKHDTEPSKQWAPPRSVTANPSIVAAGFSDGETPSLNYRIFRTNIRPGSTPCRKTWRRVPPPRPCTRSAISTCQNWRASFRLGGLVATELLHDVKRDQVVAGLVSDEGTLVIINSMIG